MKNFEFYNPVKVLFGQGEASKLGCNVAEYGKKALLISYQEHDFMSALLESSVADMQANGIDVVPFYKVVANPLLSTVEEAVALCQTLKIDVVVAIGGGSVIDAAKFIAAGATNETKVWDMVVSCPQNDQSIPPTSALPIVCISTIPATASEMNCGAVITNEETHEKAHIFSEHVFPKVSILDPTLTTTLPAYQTGCGIADAISHMLEVYLNGAENSPIQLRMMDGVVKTLIETAPIALNNPDDLDARAIVQWSACLGWNGWTHTGIEFAAPMHMIAHPLSARFNITHGATLAIIMPAFMKYTYQSSPKMYQLIGQNMLALPADSSAKDAVDAFEAFIKSLGIQSCLSDFGIKESDLTMLVDDCARVGFSPAGVLEANTPLNKEDVLNILKLAL